MCYFSGDADSASGVHGAGAHGQREVSGHEQPHHDAGVSGGHAAPGEVPHPGAATGGESQARDAGGSQDQVRSQPSYKGLF